MRIVPVLAAAFAALTSTIGLAQAPEQRFTHAGKTYAYTRTDLGNGRQVIAGRSGRDQKPFRLVVRGDRVSGTVGNVPVGFKVDDARGATSNDVVLGLR